MRHTRASNVENRPEKLFEAADAQKLFLELSWLSRSILHGELTGYINKCKIDAGCDGHFEHNLERP